MHIEFDPAKDLANQDKHGVSLAMAAELDWKPRWCGWMNGSSTARRA